MNESTIIQTLKAQFPTHIGDDAAVLPNSMGDSLVITKDLLVEDVHFRLRYTSPEALAHKALHVNLSDIAAMGATPHAVLLGLSLPSSYATALDSFLMYFTQACQAHAVTLIGGDTTSSPEKLFISVTALGHADAAQIKYRHTAQPGDIIAIAGQLGQAHLGLISLEHEHTGFSVEKKACLMPQARLNEGVWFGGQTSITAMMDVSDGLYVDIEKCAAASRCGAIIELDRLLQDTSFLNACLQLNVDPINTALCGGEDYGLLIAVKPTDYDKIEADFFKQFQYPLQKIGYFTSGQTSSECVQLHQDGHPVSWRLTPFDHFR